MGTLQHLWRKLRGIPRRAGTARSAATGATVRGESAEARLRRLAQWCTTGNLAGAELELHEWSRGDDCPATALTLLAALLARRGRSAWAMQVLHHRHRLDAEDDLGVGQLLTAVLTAADLTGAARRAAFAVHHHHGHDPGVVTWLQAIEVCNAYPLPATSEVVIERLEAELTARPLVIPSLVAAAKIKPDLPNIHLLRNALARAARNFVDDPQMLSICQAMAELSLLAGDNDEARRWAHRGLKLQPYSASLALVLAQVSDDPAVGPPALSILQRACAAHPGYPDLRAALEERQQELAA